MDLPADLLLRAPEEAVRLIARSQWSDLGKAAARLSDGKDAEAVHDARVALRRLRSALRTWKPLLRGSVRGKDRDALKDLQRASGGGRDAEVGAAWLEEVRAALPPAQRRGAAWLREHLLERASAARKEFRDQAAGTLRRLEGRLKRRLGRYEVPVSASAPPVPRRFAGHLGRELTDQVARLLGALDKVTGPDQAEQAHAARIEGKRLRYLLEPVRELLTGAETVLGRLKGLQDVLGGIQDLVAIGLLVRAAVEETAVEQARKQAKAARKAVEAARSVPSRDGRRAGLLALVREVERAREARFAELFRDWRDGPARGELREGVLALAHAAENVAHEGLEIERKYLLTGLPPDRPAGDVLEVEQGWLPGERLQERVRRVRRGDESRCWRTLKAGRGLARTEIEEETPPALFEALWPLTAGLRVFKLRHVIPDGGHVWELDEFTDRELVLAEVELSSADETVSPPAWLAPYVVRDVTDEDTYVNRNLAR